MLVSYGSDQFSISNACCQAALSMCRQGRPFGAMRYAQEVANFQQEGVMISS